MSRAYLNRRTEPHITTLVIATATGPLALNIFLPALPAMARHFDTSYGKVQLALSLYLAAMAALQLLVGPASDRFGRRPVMLGSFSIFVAATIGAILAPTLEVLLVCRVLQAFAVAGMALARAIVRDTVAPDLAASRLGYITMGMGVVPMVAPAIGGILDENFGWQSTFIANCGYGLFALLVVFLDLGETNRAPSSSLTAQFRAYPSLLRSRMFWAYSLTAAFTSGSFFAFLGGAPYISSEMLGMSPSTYGLYFTLMALGYMCGNFLSGRFSARLGINRMTLVGSAVTLFGVALTWILFWFEQLHPLSLFGPMALAGLGNGIALPSTNVGIVSVKPSLAGSASGLGGALQIGAGAVLSFLAGLHLTPESGPWPLLSLLVFAAVAALAANLWVIALSRDDAK